MCTHEWEIRLQKRGAHPYGFCFLLAAFDAFSHTSLLDHLLVQKLTFPQENQVSIVAGPAWSSFIPVVFSSAIFWFFFKAGYNYLNKSLLGFTKVLITDVSPLSIIRGKKYYYFLKDIQEWIAQGCHEDDSERFRVIFSVLCLDLTWHSCQFEGSFAFSKMLASEENIFFTTTV